MTMMDDVRALLRKSDVTPKEVATLIGEKAAEFAKERVDEAWHASRVATDRANLAESAAKAQIASLQTMYVGMLTECHQEIAELKGKLAAASCAAG